VAPTEYENVLEVKYRGFPKGLRFYPAALQRHFIRKKFHELERLCNIRFDVIWSFDNSVFFDFSALPEGVLTVSHIVDLNQNFQFVNASRTAQLCIGVSRSIVKRQKRHNPRSYFINHGFAQPHAIVDEPLPSIDRSVKVGYAGNLNLKYIDWNALRHIILSRPEAKFFFAGPFDVSAPYIKWLVKQTNVILLGRMTREEVSKFYREMDVLLLCYLANQYPEQLENSHKMMEYLGSGKIVVATFTLEYANLEEENLIAMSNNNSEFPGKFYQVLDNLSFWNSLDKQQLRKDLAFDNIYEKQLERIETLINRGSTYA